MVGRFLNAFFGGTIPNFDFAGGTVTNITSGVSALACALSLRKRRGFLNEALRSYSIVLSFVGDLLWWVGWFGFNAGSELGAGSLASTAFVAVHFAAATGAPGWVIVQWIGHGKPSGIDGISACVAVLLAITPASGLVNPSATILIGVAAGVICYLMVTKAKARFGYDDSLGAFGVHGVGGTLGTILAGKFATNVVNDGPKDSPDKPILSGLVDGHADQILKSGDRPGAPSSWRLPRPSSFLESVT